MVAIQNEAQLLSEWSSRASYYSTDHALMDKLVGVYFGQLPSEFDDYFDENMHVHLINLIRLSWDDLANRAGKLFPVRVTPDNDTPTATKRASNLERISSSWNAAGQVCGSISRSTLQKVIAWWMVGCANAVAMVLPDYEYQTPYFTFRDPRTHYPPVGWSPYTQAKADDALFAYQMSIGELKSRYPTKSGEISAKMQKYISSSGAKSSRTIERSDEELVWVGEYYHEDVWLVSTLQDNVVILAESMSGDKGHPGVMPVQSMALYSPGSSVFGSTTSSGTGTVNSMGSSSLGGAKGRSMFADQISIQAAMARMFSQQLDFYDRTLYPIIFHTRLVGQTIRIGPYATNEFDTTDGNPPKLEVISPAHQIDATQMQQFAIGMSRMLNRNPESFQGQGQADSAKALTQLEAGPTATIRDGIWPSMLEADPKLYQTAAKMEVNVWGNVRKKTRGTPQAPITYVPAVDLRDRENSFQVFPGIGVAGYQGQLQIMQELGAENISEETALEQREDIPDAETELRRIEADRIKKILRAELGVRSQAQPGMPGSLAPGALTTLLGRVEKGESLYEAMRDMDNAGALYIPMPQAPPGLPAGLGGDTGMGVPGGGIGGGPMGGGAAVIPPQIGAATGPAAAELPLQTIHALRGGPR